MKNESSGAMLMKTKISGAEAETMFTKRESSGVEAVSFLRRLRSLACNDIFPFSEHSPALSLTIKCGNH